MQDPLATDVQWEVIASHIITNMFINKEINTKEMVLIQRHALLSI